MRTRLRILRAKIKGLAEEGVNIHKRIRESSGPYKDNLWNIKREVGTEARLHILAYGFIRGKTYKEMEPNSNLDFFLLYNFRYKTDNFKKLLSIIHEYERWDRVKNWTEKYLLSKIKPSEDEKDKAA